MRASSSLGRLCHEPFGEKGLKIAESRMIVDLINNPPVGDAPCVIVVGPLDFASAAATDVLLKSLEEFDAKAVRPVLWARDETDVSGTVRSRCIRRWCPDDPEGSDEAPPGARELVAASLERRVPEVIEILRDHDHEDLLEGSAKVLRDMRERPATVLWERVRLVLRHRNPTATEVLAAFLP